MREADEKQITKMAKSAMFTYYASSEFATNLQIKEIRLMQSQSLLSSFSCLPLIILMAAVLIVTII